MKSKIISDDPDFSRTIKVKCYDFENVLNFERLKKIIDARKRKEEHKLHGKDGVACNISKTMAQTNSILKILFDALKYALWVKKIQL